MESIRPLPVRESLLPGESLTSLTRRTADAMGYEHLGRIRALLADVGCGDEHVLSALAYWASQACRVPGNSASTLSKFSIASL